MKTKQLGNLFELAEKQILAEIKQGKRKIEWYSLNINNKKLLRPYKFTDLLDYAIILRKQIDRYGKKGEINKVRNIKTNKFVLLETKKEVRHRKYLKERTKKWLNIR
jgi:hypothetical protein